MYDGFNQKCQIIIKKILFVVVVVVIYFVVVFFLKVLKIAVPYPKNVWWG